MAEEIIVLDMRTPGEYALGHLEGARLVDFNAGEADAAIAELDPQQKYVLYCHTGMQSGITASRMQLAGFADATNLGSLEEAAAATGLSIVTNDA